ncbi:hypothetical protein OG563_25220 [Nocardia vinacea]|uniref:Uncharacterized protein n=2 Tax=Nocardia vinacea TaxID=96468 RepID=A0ABZ1YLB3_9NOCA|nr:hypothetical protein [Nocardia vinacea]
MAKPSCPAPGRALDAERSSGLGKPLDIGGGPMTCVISGKADADGRYCLVVTQSPNRSTYKVEFSDADHAVVFDSAGTRLYELERF